MVATVVFAPGLKRAQTLVMLKVYSRHDAQAMLSLGFEEQPS
jgi:hypothetical protein